jgi:hypothetical protein
MKYELAEPNAKDPDVALLKRLAAGEHMTMKYPDKCEHTYTWYYNAWDTQMMAQNILLQLDTDSTGIVHDLYELRCHALERFKLKRPAPTTHTMNFVKHKTVKWKLSSELIAAIVARSTAVIDATPLDIQTAHDGMAEVQVGDGETQVRHSRFRMSVESDHMLSFYALCSRGFRVFKVD